MGVLPGEFAELADVHSDIIEKLGVHGAEARHCLLFEAVGPPCLPFRAHPGGNSPHGRKARMMSARSIRMSVHGSLLSFFRLLGGRIPKTLASLESASEGVCGETHNAKRAGF